jgi:hypothetical protein
MTTLDQLKETAKTFEANTKKFAASCKNASLTITEKLEKVSGDFGKKQDAVDAMIAWTVAFRKLNGKPSISIIGKTYHVEINF